MRAEIDRLIDTFAAGKIDPIDDAVRARKAKLQRLETQLQGMNGRQALDEKAFSKKILPLVKSWSEDFRASPESAQVVLRKILPKRLTVTPTPSGG